MTSIFPNGYQIKKALLWPRTLLMRWQYRNSSEPMKMLLEQHYYRPAVLDFVAATNANRHILHDAEIDSDSVVVDVGAFTGSWAQQMVERYDPVIYAFEPNPGSFDLLLQKAANNPKLQPMPYGLGDEDVIIDMALNGPDSSLCNERSSNANSRRIKVDIAAIDRVWKDLKLGQIDLMRIDIGGAEFRLLDKMVRTGLVNKVNCFMIQFHEGHPGATVKRRKIREELSKTHRLEWDYYFVWEKWVRI